MSDRGVSGMIALVTGASGALGRAIAVRLGTGGAIVACHYGSNRMGAQETVDAIRAGGGDGMTVGGNVTLREDVDAMVASVLEAHGRIDILVNCAGITRDGLLVRMDDADWDDVIAANLRSAFLGTRAVMRSMMKQRSGRILNVTSVIGVSGNAGQANYAAAKAGMIGLTRSTARKLQAGESPAMPWPLGTLTRGLPLPSPRNRVPRHLRPSPWARWALQTT